jgi:dimethylhistidine N-methyltransferase
MIMDTIDLHPRFEDFRRDVLAGLMSRRKQISPKFLYDHRGSDLFEKICSAPEYYPTRTELKILKSFGDDITKILGPSITLIEFGSGASLKTRLVLDRLESPLAYVPIDISKQFLLQSCESLSGSYPDLPICPVSADYTQAMDSIGYVLAGYPRKVAFFPGSTIGNLDPTGTRDFLRGCARVVGPGGRLLIGFDLVKSIPVLEAAYNDQEGVTAEFNLNLLVRMNRELKADFDLSHFRHHAYFNLTEQRIEMHLVSQIQQIVNVAGVAINFGEEETIHTESSYKYTLEGFTQMAKGCALELLQAWTDENGYFAVALLQAAQDTESYQAAA